MRNVVFAFVFVGICAAAGAASNDRKEQSADLLRPGRAEIKAAKQGFAGPSAADVGDADSFGRNVHFIGVAQSGTVSALPDCTPDPSSPPGPDDRCATIDPGTQAASIEARDIGRINLPAKASNSLLCHSVTSFPFWHFFNGTAGPVNARFNYGVGFTIDNEVLNDPSLIDPTTGLPFGGHLEVPFGNLTTDQETLQAGASATHRNVDTRFCIAGVVSKASLMETYGLTAAQADTFFKKPMTVHLNLTMSTRWADDALSFFGLRLFGD